MLPHACSYVLANKDKDMRTLQGYLSHRNVAHTGQYT
jgi:hypothetical protein